MKLYAFLLLVAVTILLAPTGSAEERRLYHCDNGLEQGQNCIEVIYGVEDLCYNHYQDMNENEEPDEGDIARQQGCVY